MSVQHAGQYAYKGWIGFSLPSSMLDNMHIYDINDYTLCTFRARRSVPLSNNEVDDLLNEFPYGSDDERLSDSSDSEDENYVPKPAEVTDSTDDELHEADESGDEDLGPSTSQNRKTQGYVGFIKICTVGYL